MDVWERLETFVSRLHSDMPDGEYAIHHSDIFARIASYKTKLLHEGRLEAHKRYVDIQIVLTGFENIDVVPLNGLIPDTDDDEQNDVRFYKVGGIPAVRIFLEPGSFALFFPQDAHCPQLTPHTGEQNVKKVVVKIDARLLNTGHSEPT